jgi:hypothetical protein
VYAIRVIAVDKVTHIVAIGVFVEDLLAAEECTARC